MLSISRQHELKSLVNVSIERPLWELFHFICWFRQSFRSWNNNLYFALKIMVELVTSNNLFHSDVEGLDGKDEPHDISTVIVWRRYFCVYAKINLCFSSPTDCGAEFFLNLVGGGKRSCTSAAGSRAAKWQLASWMKDRLKYTLNWRYHFTPRFKRGRVVWLAPVNTS